MNMLRIVYMLALLIPVSGAAQEGRALIRKVNEVYNDAPGVSMSFVMDYYASNTQKTPTVSTKGEVKYDKKHYYSKAMGQTVLVNSRYSLVVSEAQKSISLFPGNKESLKKQNELTALPDSGLPASAMVTVIAQTATSKRIKIVEQGGLYSSTELLVNLTTYALEEVVFIYRKLENGTVPKVIVRYNQVSFSPLNDELFSEKKFIQKKNGQLTAAAAWSGYQIIDLTSTPKQ